MKGAKHYEGKLTDGKKQLQDVGFQKNNEAG